MSIRIAGVGSYVPEKVLTNADMEKIVETSDEWIRTRTGIEERHIAAPDEFTSDMALQAARRALEKARLAPEDLDGILVATTTPDQILPNTAVTLSQKLGCRPIFCCDIMAACTGLLYGLEVGYSMVKTRPDVYRHFLVCGAERLSSITNWSDRNTCVLLGDGAGAVILSHVPDGQPDMMVASDIRAQYSEVLMIPAGGCKMPSTPENIAAQMQKLHMAGRETFKLAVTAMVNACRTVLERSGAYPEDVKLAIPHQANQRIIEAVAQRLGIPQDRVYKNIAKFGNTSSASVGIALDEAISTGRLERGDLVLFTAFGGGLTWGAMLLRY